MAARIDERTQFVDDGGLPIVNGKIYIGVVGLDPKLNPLGIFSDRDLTVPLANPQSTDGNGRSGSKIWVPGKYSILVEDAAGNQKLQDLDSGTLGNVGYTGVADVLGTNAITGSASTTISSYVDLQAYVFKVFANNSGATTLNIDNVGVKAITKNGGDPLVGGELEENNIAIVVWNETSDYFELQTPDAALADLVAQNVLDIATNTANIAKRDLPPEYIDGCRLSQSTGDADHDIVVTAGRMRDSTDAVNIVLTAQTGQCDVAFGTGNGILEENLTLTADTDYYPFVIAKANSADPALFLFNAADPSGSLPTDYVYFRALNEGRPLRTDSGANLINSFHGVFRSPLFFTAANAISSDYPHALGSMPKTAKLYGIRKTAAGSYTIGQRVPLGFASSGTNFGHQINYTDTVVNVAVGTGGILVMSDPGTTNTYIGTSNTDWDYQLIAELED